MTSVSQFSGSAVSDSLQTHGLQLTGLPVHHQLPEFTQTHVHWVSDAIQPSLPCRSLRLLHSIFPSIRVFSNYSVLPMRWPKYWSFSFNISPSNEHSGLISFRRTGSISLQSKGLSRVFSNTTNQNLNSSTLSFLYSPTLTSIHDYRKSQIIN